MTKLFKTLLTVAVLGSSGGFASLVMAQGKQGETFGEDVSSALRRLEAQCAHRRRTMPPDERDDCARRLRSDAQIVSGQGGGVANGNQAAGAGPGIGPGNGGGQGNGIGPGGNGGGKGGGRR